MVTSDKRGASIEYSVFRASSKSNPTPGGGGSAQSNSSRSVPDVAQSAQGSRGGEEAASSRSPLVMDNSNESARMEKTVNIASATSLKNIHSISVMLPTRKLPDIPPEIAVALDNICLKPKEGPEWKATNTTFTKILAKHGDEMTLYPEVYLTILKALKYSDEDRRPGRRINLDIDAFYPTDKSFSGVKGDRITMICETLAAIGISEPKGQVHAVAIAVGKGDTLTLLVGGNNTINENVKTLYENVWANLQLIANCLEDKSTIPTTKPIESPPRKLRKGMQDALLTAERSLFEILVSFAMKKTSYRYRNLKGLGILKQMIQKKESTGWSDPKLGKSIKEFLRELSKVSQLVEKWRVERNATKKGEIERLAAEALYSAFSKMGDFDGDEPPSGGKSQGVIDVRQWVRSVSQELEMNERRSMEDPNETLDATSMEFNFERFFKKSLAPVLHFQVLIATAYSARLSKHLLARKILVVLLPPQYRNVELPTQKHVLLAIANAFTTSGYQDKTTRTHLRGERVRRVLVDLGLLGNDADWPPDESSSSILATTKDVENITIQSSSSGSRQTAHNLTPTDGVEGTLENLDINKESVECEVTPDEVAKLALKIIEMLLHPLEYSLDLEDLRSTADAYVQEFKQRVKRKSFQGFVLAAYRWTNNPKNRNTTAWKNIRDRFLASHQALQQEKGSSSSLKQSPTSLSIKAESGTKSADKIPVHYECLVLAKVHEMLTNIENNDEVFGYIGVSKLCCLFCALYFRGYNETADKPIVVRGSHGRVYDKVSTPVLGLPDEELERVLLNRLYTELVDQLLAAPTRAHKTQRTSSESSIEMMDTLGRNHKIYAKNGDIEDRESANDNRND